MGGASYFGIVQWFTGATRPPHLAALMPYDGMSDLYRECAFHGGIPNHGFVRFWNDQRRCSLNRAEDWVEAMKVHPFVDDYWKSKMPAVEDINVPTYVIASWSDHAVHTRGSLSAYMRLGTEQKWLEVHGRNKWARMDAAESVRRRMAFFDRFLKDQPNEVDAWSRVRLEVREGIDVGQGRTEENWPLARTEYTPHHLDASTASLSPAPVAAEAPVSYDATAAEPVAVFSHTFERDTELTGYFKLKLWVETDGAGDLVRFYYTMRFRFGHATHEWLRVSHSELDTERSTPFQPVHLHLREPPVKPSKILPSRSRSGRPAPCSAPASRCASS